MAGGTTGWLVGKLTAEIGAADCRGGLSDIPEPLVFSAVARFPLRAGAAAFAGAVDRPSFELGLPKIGCVLNGSFDGFVLNDGDEFPLAAGSTSGLWNVPRPASGKSGKRGPAGMAPTDRTSGGASDGVNSGGGGVSFVSTVQPEAVDVTPVERGGPPSGPNPPPAPVDTGPGWVVPLFVVIGGAVEDDQSGAVVAGAFCGQVGGGETPLLVLMGVAAAAVPGFPAGGGALTPNNSPTCQNPSAAVPSVCSVAFRTLSPVNSSCRVVPLVKSWNCELNPCPTLRVPSMNRFPAPDICSLAC